MSINSSDVVVDHHYICQPTPQTTWRTRQCSSEKKPRRRLISSPHKNPSGDSPYVRAKRIQLIDKNPSKAVSLFWAAINSGDRVDSALKDMATAMKQLDRSDEAIEAIKSFRHLCPNESQESLDNVMVELYKHSDRIEEEIEILRRKVRQVEEGIVFGGKRTKMAKSQGKKIEITVEKEYSRLLGNLAWAYMKQKDFKSAEEHYRKALSFRPDKNKQCNLALCLMHMNKLAEAKFLLQAIRSSSVNGCIDESYAKSYNCASQLLTELELQSDLIQPVKQAEHNNGIGINREFLDGNPNKMEPVMGRGAGFCCQKKIDSFQSPPLPLFLNKMNRKGFSESPCKKRADFDWRIHRDQVNMSQEGDCAMKRIYDSPFCNGGSSPKVPSTQPRLCSRAPNDGRSGQVAHGGYCRKLSFVPSIDTEMASKAEIPRVMPQSLKEHLPSVCGDWRKNSLENFEELPTEQEQPLESNEERTNLMVCYGKEKPVAEGCDFRSDLPLSADRTKIKKISDNYSGQSCNLSSAGSIGPSDVEIVENLNLLRKTLEISTLERKKSWADAVEEEEQEMDSWRNDYPLNYSGNTCQESFFSYQIPSRFSICSMSKERFNDENVNSNIMSETPTSLQLEKLSQEFDFESGYCSQPEKTTLLMKEHVRRSLCLDRNQKLRTEKNHCTSPLLTKAVKFEGHSLPLSE